MPDLTPFPDTVSRVPDAILALQRANAAWNKTQLLDAIRSAETFITAAKQAVGTAVPLVRNRIVITPRSTAPTADRFARDRQALQQAIDKCADGKN